MRAIALLLSATLVSLAQSQTGYYTLQDSFLGGPTFLDNFNFWTSWDPTFGFVHYVDQAFAEQFSMITTTDSTVAWGVDTTQILDPDANLGRLSIRLSSIQRYTRGLFVLDLAHMPVAACGSWPSFWTLGGTGVWPSSGEIDIIELVNQVPDNLMSLHTLPGCTVAAADETGTLLSSNCGFAGGFEGCTVQATSPFNSGTEFNAAGGGVYAMEWTSAAIRMWFFPRNAIPATLLSPFPDVSALGVPMANFAGSCNIDSYFSNHSLMFDIDFCGSWAGPTFQADGCPPLDPTNSWSSCNEFVALNPGAFTETYWEVNYLNVYSLIPGTAPTSTSSLSSVTPAVSTSSVSSILSNANGRSTTPTMSLAGTTPHITTGSFTATSSVLSVLSSLSASSVSASLASAQTTPTTSLVTPSPMVTGPTTTSVAATSPPSPASMTSSMSVTCNGAICTYVYTSVVIETITVHALLEQSPDLAQDVVFNFDRWGNEDEHTMPTHLGAMKRAASTTVELSSSASTNTPAASTTPTGVSVTAFPALNTLVTPDVSPDPTGLPIPSVYSSLLSRGSSTTSAYTVSSTSHSTGAETHAVPARLLVVSCTLCTLVIIGFGQVV
ncbi:concanavalin A-like lectin/glucanase domain-containing protein [Neohortaea acidophila]|uniref:Concanavalin A-like lectin/glucanase domain-containing protein n=1 Tax=Neohortaea acidophila TaxID=245834 RepID=A0A6A6PR63_9PEZI|nr:concanavalin A-like lectin/glucanase domain-containing protein [Neohortaea acidophila]KAF2482405.1 concanavalin A-like lectin/glucanase domain-containing protein [Neohortaea acidophila]